MTLLNPSHSTDSDSGCWVVIDQLAIAANLDAILAVLPSSSALCAVIKGDGYGHGIENVLPILMDRNVTMVGIADTREARQVRELGFEGRILRVRTAAPQEARAAIGIGVEEMIGGIDHAVDIASVAAASDVSIPVHIVLNSAGLCRDGVDLSDASGRRDARAIVNLAPLDLIGVVTHFATEEVDDTQAMLSRFLEDVAWLRSLLPERALETHCASSFAALMVPESRLDIVRIGGALFGETAATAPELRRAMSLRSRITALNNYPSGSFVGYDRSHLITAPARLASVPIGYANGYRRAFDGRGEALVRGHRAHVLGHVSMNTLILDVTSVQDVRIGDEVVFFGHQGSEELTAADLERTSATPVIDLFTIWGAVNSRHIS